MMIMKMIVHYFLVFEDYFEQIDSMNSNLKINYFQTQVAKVD